ncbi:MAG: M28 family peptidase [Bryobacteraceae bacterium]
MKRILILLAVLAARSPGQIVPDSLLRTILDEISADNVLEHSRQLAARHRLPSSRGFLDAARYVQQKAAGSGLKNVRLEKFETIGEEWDPLEGELDVLEPEPVRIASIPDTPLAAMTRSREGDVTGVLIDAGAGHDPEDYRDLDLNGKIVLTRSVPPANVWREAEKRGAVALLCAESRQFFGRAVPRDAISWLRAPEGAFAMAVSPMNADRLARWLRDGKKVRLHMRLKTAVSRPAFLGQVMGEVPGELKGRDVVLVAHLDHPKPGANDNASGSAVLLECARVLHALMESGRVPRPKRGIRIWWTKEIVSPTRYFERYPEQKKEILLAVNVDQAGGDRMAENNFVVIYGPDWLPSWADDLVHDLVEDVAARYAPAEKAPSRLLIAPGGSLQSFRAVYWPYAPLSDHVAFESRTVGIPAISMAVPSLNVVHSDRDTVDRLDPTWLKRTTLIALASALFAANAGPEDAAALLEAVFVRAVARIAAAEDRQGQLKIEQQRLESVKALSNDVQAEPYMKRLRAVVAALESR